MKLKTPMEMAEDTAKRFRRVRKMKGIKLKDLSETSGVPYSTLRRFESSGEIAFTSLVKLASAMNEDAEIENLFANYVPTSIEEVIRGNNQ